MGQQIPQNVKDKVLELYQLDDFTRLCPGKKGCVSVFLNGKKVHKQKRLILLRLKELYIQFKKMHPNHKIGFSKFCELRSKWYITVNSSGVHCICVCIYHQNAKLMRSFLPENQYNKDLMKLCVCAVEDRNCMFHLCKGCLDKTELLSSLITIFDSNDFDFDSTIYYKQQVSNNRTTLVTLESAVNEFIDILTDKIFELCHHHFIKVQQAAHLKETKAMLDNETSIILIDFVENYTVKPVQTTTSVR